MLRKKVVINPLKVSYDSNDYLLLQALFAKYENIELFKATTTYYFRDDQFRYNCRLTHPVSLFNISPVKDDFAYQDKFTELLSLHQEGIIYPDIPYFLGISTSSITTALYVQLTHTVLAEKIDKDGMHVSGSGHYIVSAKEHGAGDFGATHLVPVKINIQDDTLLMDFNPLIVKQFTANTARRDVKFEYIFAKKAGHLEPVIPIKYFDTYYMLMRQMPGSSLKEIIDDIFAGKSLSLERRLQIALGVLKAVRNQVHSKNMVHNDIKDSNFLVDLMANPVEINIVDFGLAAETNKNYKDVSNYNHVAPELRGSRLQLQHQSVDIYSCARLLSELFGVKTYKMTYRDCWGESTDGMYKVGLFKHPDCRDFNTTARSKFVRLIDRMGSVDPMSRPSIKMSIKKMEAVIEAQNTPAEKQANHDEKQIKLVV